MTPKIPLTTPLGKIKDTAIGAIKDPVGTAGKVVGQARGTASVGRSVVGGVVGQVVAHVPGRHLPPGRGPESEPLRSVPSPSPAKEHGDPLTDDAEAGSNGRRPTADPAAPSPLDVAPQARAAAATAPSAERPQKAARARKATPATKAAPDAGPAPAAKSQAEQTAAQSTAAKKVAAKKAPAKKTTAKKATAKKAPSKKAAVTDPARRGPAKDEVVYTSESTDTPAGPGDKLPSRRRGAESKPLLDPALTKKVAAEAERGLRAADGQPD